MAINAIPTMYRGIQFRSRLEARYACFFDRIGWVWKYEPFDLNGYIPDFIISFEREVLVEVKPECSIKRLSQYRKKIDDSGWDKDALIVGAAPWAGESMMDIAAGICRQEDWMMVKGIGKKQWSWDIAGYMKCRICKRFSFVHESGSYACPLCGRADGDHHCGHADGLQELWAEACNETQWKGSGT